MPVVRKGGKGRTGVPVFLHAPPSSHCDYYCLYRFVYQLCCVFSRAFLMFLSAVSKSPSDDEQAGDRSMTNYNHTQVQAGLTSFGMIWYLAIEPPLLCGAVIVVSCIELRDAMLFAVDYRGGTRAAVVWGCSSLTNEKNTHDS